MKWIKFASPSMGTGPLIGIEQRVANTMTQKSKSPSMALSKFLGGF